MRRTVGVALAPIVIGVVAGGLWVALADRWYWTVTDGQLTMGESAASGQFRAVALFVVIGVVSCALWGVAIAITSRASWRLVPFIIASALAAAVVAWQVGLLIGPPDPGAHPAGLSEGDTVAARFVIDSVVPFLLWPVGGLAGLLAATIFLARSEGARARGSAAAVSRR